jgi:hypothetical protein
MITDFKAYIEAEAREILDSIESDVRNDPERFRREVIEWIDKNAEQFRRRWEKRYAC